MNKYITEFIGTFFLVLVIGLTVDINSEFAPIAIGSILIALVYMGGHISGAHYNPAVTVAVILRGLISIPVGLIYIIVQVIAAIIAAYISTILTGESLLITSAPQVSASQALLVEVLLTFALVSVILNVATSKNHPNNSFYGLAIGFTIMGCIYVGGPISGGAFNPAVAIGHNLLSQSLSNIWIYLVGPFSGGIMASLIFRLTNPEEFN